MCALLYQETRLMLCCACRAWSSCQQAPSPCLGLQQQWTQPAACLLGGVRGWAWALLLLQTMQQAAAPWHAKAATHPTLAAKASWARSNEWVL
jgi:hypothetical protein